MLLLCDVRSVVLHLILHRVYDVGERIGCSTLVVDVHDKVIERRS